MMNCYQEISARNSNICIFTNSKNIYNDIISRNKTTDYIIYLDTLKYYSEINFTIIMQYLTYLISIKSGINPDKPRNLAKVVTVE